MRIFRFYVNSKLKSLLSAFSPYTKCFCKTTRKISNEFYHGELIIRFFWRFLKTQHQNLKKMAQFFQVSIHFHHGHPQQQMTGNSFSAVK